MLTSTSQRQIATFGSRRKSPPRRRRMHNSSSRVHKASRRHTSRPESGTRLATPIKSLTACKSYLFAVIPRDIPVTNFRPKERRFYFGATSCTCSAFSCQTQKSQWYLMSTQLRPRPRGINRFSDNVVPCQALLNVLTRALRRARHFALVEGSAIPTKGSLVIVSGQKLSSTHASLRSHLRS